MFVSTFVSTRWLKTGIKQRLKRKESHFDWKRNTGLVLRTHLGHSYSLLLFWEVPVYICWNSTTGFFSEQTHCKHQKRERPWFFTYCFRKTLDIYYYYYFLLNHMCKCEMLNRMHNQGKAHATGVWLTVSATLPPIRHLFYLETKTIMCKMWNFELYARSG